MVKDEFSNILKAVKLCKGNFVGASESMEEAPTGLAEGARGPGPSANPQALRGAGRWQWLIRGLDQMMGETGTRGVPDSMSTL